MNAGDRLLASQHQAGHLGLVAVLPRDQLVDAGSRTNRAAGRQRGTGEQVSGLGTMDVPLESLGVVQPLYEQHLLAMWRQRLEYLAEFHLGTGSLGRPLGLVETVSREQASEPDRSVAASPRGQRFVGPDVHRFHPRQSHADTQPTQHRTTGETVTSHITGHGSSLSRNSIIRLGSQQSPMIPELTAGHDILHDHRQAIVVRPEIFLDTIQQRFVGQLD